MARKSIAWPGLALLTFMVAATSATVARAQGPGLPPGAPPAAAPATNDNKVFTNKTVFHLPIQIDNRTRALLREVCLYVKMGNGEWQRKDVAPPTQSLFKFSVSQDGEYAFNVVTVDQNGVTQPSNLPTMQPGLVVVVDTKTPDLDIQVASEGGQRYLRCVMADEHPSPDTIRAAYQAADQSWRPLDMVPGQPGLFRISEPEILQSRVKIMGMDQMKNAATKEVNMRDLVSNPLEAPTTAADNKTGNTGNTGVTLAGGLPTVGKGSPLPPPGPPPEAQPAPPPPITPVRAQETKVNNVVPAVGHDTPLLNGGRQIINSTRASIDYKVDQAGPSGVARVDIYLTGDNGQSWRKLCEDPDHRSPAEVDLPGEGVYGLKLVLTNGNGFGAQPPQRGEQPAISMEVDTTPPFLQLREVDPIVTDGNLDIRWSCSDKNLTGEPISLHYSQRKEGPWTPIAKNLKNDGAHKWAYPREAGGQFYLRVEAIDLAGNVARADSINPVNLDTTEPRAQVINITPVLKGQ